MYQLHTWMSGLLHKNRMFFLRTRLLPMRAGIMAMSFGMGISFFSQPQASASIPLAKDG